MTRKLSVLLLALLALVSCKSQYDALLASNDVDAKYKAAFDYFNQGKYQKSAAMFESLSMLTSGTEKDDTVQYYRGLSNYRYKDFETAEGNFASFVETYPHSTFTPEALFLRLDCLYRATYRYELDQAPTRTAMQAINEYLRAYPSSDHAEDCRGMLKELGDRLDTKAFESAKRYFKMEDYMAARVALKNVLRDDAENIYREEILYYIAKSSYKYAQLSVHAKQRERYLTFIDDYLNFVGEAPESPYRREMDALYARAQRALGRHVDADELLSERDKDFERERKASAKTK